MIVSWNWLKDYVPLDVPADQLAHRLSMAGLNHETTTDLGYDLAIDLEVTSNRPDCLGHIGVAREIAVLWQRPLDVPSISMAETGPPASSLTRVSITCPRLCFRYIARVIRGVRIGPSPDWLVDRLQAIGIAAVNNVVDATNYVLMECGQPLHAFDLAKLAGAEIIVREALPGEQFLAINHKLYDLQPGMCVIADAERSVALGGVMGGADTEVGEATTDLLIESAEFAPLSIRTTARALGLHSPSSYRFERGVDPRGVDWASRRCCQLILELAGGELAGDAVDVGPAVAEREPVVLRLSQLPRVLGIEIPAAEVRRMLTALGCTEQSADASCVTVVPPTWRRDLTREIDLVEEVARIHGYDQIPEDVGVPMAPSHRGDEERVLDRVRSVLTAAGLDEAMTSSVVPEAWHAVFCPWTDAAPLHASTPMLKGADRLRCSLIPSLLEACRINQSLGNPVIELFETARIYLPRGSQLPREPWTLGITSGGDYFRVKGVAEAILAALNPALNLEVTDTRQPLLDPARSAQLSLGGRLLGYLGEVTEKGLKDLGLRAATTVAELDLSVLVETACLIPQHQQQSPYPPIERDLNLIVDESVRWSQLERTVRDSAGQCLESVRYQETYRDPQKDGQGKKRQLFSITLRSAERTLTNEEADQIRDQVVAACHQAHQAVLLGA
jgi:phenylalanyl-tRNA synthetase beta chain